MGMNLNLNELSRLFHAWISKQDRKGCKAKLDQTTTKTPPQPVKFLSKYFIIIIQSNNLVYHRTSTCNMGKL